MARYFVMKDHEQEDVTGWMTDTYLPTCRKNCKEDSFCAGMSAQEVEELAEACAMSALSEDLGTEVRKARE